MTDRPHRGPIDYERLGGYLRVLGVPTRVLLLHKLQLPHTAAEIQLPAFRKAREHRDGRPISRQGVEKHLRKLEEIGLVRSRASTREGQPAREYVVNPGRLFMVVDDLRRLAKLQPAPGTVQSWSPTGGGTAERSVGPDSAPPPDGLSLLLVSGPAEGRAFPLDGDGPWTIGRSASSDVAVPYDPYVSGTNTELRRNGDRFVVQDLEASKNGTMVNWRLVPRGGEVELGCGDTLGVGRSLLVLRVR